MKKITLLISTTFVILAASIGLPQGSGSVAGLVKDDKSVVMHGALATVKDGAGMTVTVPTGFDGKFATVPSSSPLTFPLKPAALNRFNMSTAEAGQQSSTAQRGRPGPPAGVREMFEGTWQLEEWNIDGQVLKPPQAHGRWSLHDGVVLIILHRADTAESAAGYGEYRLDATTWGFHYTRMQRTAGPTGGPVTVSLASPEPLRTFTIKQEPGKVIFENAESRFECDGTFVTFSQRGQLVRKWRRIV